MCNVERYLDQCIDSIKAQTLDDIEIICVNDGSKDSSLEILRRHAASDDRIRIIDKPNAGYGHTINRGIEAARGAYIGIVESDDFIEPDMFETLYALAEKDHLDIARSNYWLYWSTPEERNDLMECYFPDRCDKVFNPRELTEVFFFPPALWSMLVRRDLIVNNGLKLLETPGASFQDTSFSFKLWACAERAELDALLTILVESNTPVFTDSVAIFADKLKKLFKSLRFASERIINNSAQHVAMRRLLFLAQPLVICGVSVAPWVGDDGEIVLQTYEVGEPPHGASGAEEVAELCRAVERCGVENDVRVYMLPVHMGTDDVGVFTLEEAFSQLAPDAVRLLRCNLTGLE